MYRHFICAIALAFPQSEVAVGTNDAAALQNSAAEYASQKQFAQAAKLYEQAQAMLEKSLGSNHPATVAGAQRYEAFRRSLMPELLDRFVTITSLAEFRDREFDPSVAETRELLPLAPIREESYELESMLQRTNDRRFLIHMNLADEYRVLSNAEASLRHRRIYLDTRQAEFFRYAGK